MFIKDKHSHIYFKIRSASVQSHKFFFRDKIESGRDDAQWGKRKKMRKGRKKCFCLLFFFNGFASSSYSWFPVHTSIHVPLKNWCVQQISYKIKNRGRGTFFHCLLSKKLIENYFSNQRFRSALHWVLPTVLFSFNKVGMLSRAGLTTSITEIITT